MALLYGFGNLSGLTANCLMSYRRSIIWRELGVASRTKAKEQFKHPPLYPFWHKHFSTPRHLLRNIGDRWGLDGNGKPLLALLNDLARDHGHDPDRWPAILAYRLVHTGYLDRSARGLTGDWIIFAKHEDQNYYLDLATHAEGEAPIELYTKLRNASAAEFPFLFEEIGASPADVGISE